MYCSQVNFNMLMFTNQARAPQHVAHSFEKTADVHASVHADMHMASDVGLHQQNSSPASKCQ